MDKLFCLYKLVFYFLIIHASPEAEKVEDIVKDVKNKLRKMPQSNVQDFKGLVGLEKHMDQIQSLLCLSNCDVVRAIAIWGMGGIGKTTLAKAVFKKFSCEFEGRCCFVENVREKWADGSKREKLKQELQSKILEDENPYNAMERLRDEKVLIVLDDVDNVNQLKLLGDDYCRGFGRGSRIILTTRNEEMLQFLKVDGVETELYEVDKLNDAEALQLFNLMAFEGQSSEADKYIETSMEVVQNYAGGNPLALVVFGSFLRCKGKEEWKNCLNQLKEKPNDEIQEVLKISYDGLHENEQRVFLDVACFFKGIPRHVAEQIMDFCYYKSHISAKTRISNLRERSLITIGETGILLMHDLLQEMGRKIVNSFHTEPGKRSRLWDTQDICNVLKNNMGTEAIEGIKLTLNNIGTVEFGPLAFEGIDNLRYLGITDYSSEVIFPRGLYSLPSSLRYIQWWGCNLEYIPPEFSAHNLYGFSMIFCKLKKLWIDDALLPRLEHIVLTLCANLTRIPYFSHAPNLQSICISYCPCLVEVPPLIFLVYEDQIDQRRIREDLGTVIIRCCPNLHNIPYISGNVKRLDLTGSGIIEFDPSIKNLSRLIKLVVRHCKNLTALPQLPLSLRILDAVGCESLETVATSQSKITQAHWKDYHITHYEQFQFSGCLKMDKYSRQRLMNESHIRVLRTAVLTISKAKEISTLLKDQKPVVQMCIPGNEIPEWVRYKSEKSSFTIKLQPNWHVNFIGFAVCAIALDGWLNCEVNKWASVIRCSHSFKTNNEHNVKYSSYVDLNTGDQYIENVPEEYLPKYGRNDNVPDTSCVKDDHLFIWYSHEDQYIKDYRDASEISFEFQVFTPPNNFVPVQRCGVHLLYRQEVGKLGMNYHGLI